MNSGRRRGEAYTGDYNRMERYVQIGEQWFFDTRESIEGPFATPEQAALSLEVYLRKLSGRALLVDVTAQTNSEESLPGTENFMNFS